MFTQEHSQAWLYTMKTQTIYTTKDDSRKQIRKTKIHKESSLQDKFDGTNI